MGILRIADITSFLEYIYIYRMNTQRTDKWCCCREDVRPGGGGAGSKRFTG